MDGYLGSSSIARRGVLFNPENPVWDSTLRGWSSVGDEDSSKPLLASSVPAASSFAKRLFFLAPWMDMHVRAVAF